MNRKGKTNGKRHEPAASVIAKFGGVRALARALDVDPSCVSHWQTRKRHGNGSDGLIPAKYHWTLLTIAKEKAIKLTAADLIGRAP